VETPHRLEPTSLPWLRTQVRRCPGFPCTLSKLAIRDRDAKLCRGFDDVFCSAGAEVLLTPVQAPNANAYAERWIRTVRAECLDWLLIVGRRHLAQVLRVHVAHDNAHRPTERLVWSRPIHRPIRPSSAGIGTVCTGGIGSAACSTSTTDKLHERISAPYGQPPTIGEGHGRP
jgi:hypothetical protein